jgi:hypothetical protein
MLVSEGALGAFIALLHDLSAYFEDDLHRFVDLLVPHLQLTSSPPAIYGHRRCSPFQH